MKFLIPHVFATKFDLFSNKLLANHQNDLARILLHLIKDKHMLEFSIQCNMLNWYFIYFVISFTTVFYAHLIIIINQHAFETVFDLFSNNLMTRIYYMLEFNIQCNILPLLFKFLWFGSKKGYFHILTILNCTIFNLC